VYQGGFALFVDGVLPRESHMVEYDSFIKGQLASRNQL